MALASKKSISLEEVTQLPFALSFSSYSTIQFFVDSFNEKELYPNICMEINDIHTLFEIVKKGNWHTILSDASINDRRVIGIPIEGKNETKHNDYFS